MVDARAKIAPSLERVERSLKPLTAI